MARSDGFDGSSNTGQLPPSGQHVKGCFFFPFSSKGETVFKDFRTTRSELDGQLSLPSPTQGEDARGAVHGLCDPT
eukprot:scaffold4222_cov115-Cylindrotheca_fusiformis.AAC.5